MTIRTTQPVVRDAEGGQDGIGFTFQMAIHPGWVTKALCAVIVGGGIAALR